MQHIIPPGSPAPKNPLTPGVRAGDYVYVSGQVASTADGTILCGDFEREVAQVLDNVERVLQAAGGSLADVCKINAYLSNAILFPRFNELYGARIGSPAPARTTLVVGFAHPDVRVEIDAVAYLPVSEARS